MATTDNNLTTTIPIYIGEGKYYTTPKYTRRCKYCSRVFKTLQAKHIHQEKNKICKERDHEFGVWKFKQLINEETSITDLIPKIRVKSIGWKLTSHGKD